MDILQQLKDEFSKEYTTTKKFIDVFPEEKNNYAPHKKSMKLMDLSVHIVDIFNWPKLMLNTNDFDMADEHETEKIENKAQLKATLDQNYKESLSALNKASESDLEPNWSLSMKGEKLMEWTKHGAIRHALNQITHHRAQLGVYFRLLDIPLPGSYGPSADDQSF